MQEGKKTYDETKAEHEHGLYIWPKAAKRTDHLEAFKTHAPLPLAWTSSLYLE